MNKPLHLCIRRRTERFFIGNQPEFALFQIRQPVGYIKSRLHIMRHDDGRRMELALCINNQMVYIHATQRIQTGCRFVIQDYLWLQGNSPGQADSLFHAA